MNNILKPILERSSKILNPKNKNHWICMLRGYAVNDGWNKYEAQRFFTLNLFKTDFEKGLTPKQTFENYKQEVEQPF